MIRTFIGAAALAVTLASPAAGGECMGRWVKFWHTPPGKVEARAVILPVAEILRIVWPAANLPSGYVLAEIVARFPNETAPHRQHYYANGDEYKTIVDCLRAVGQIR